MDLPFLTETEVSILTRRGLGVRLTADVLATRDAVYERTPGAHRWDRVERGLQLAHVKTDAGQGYRWRQREARFLPCPCAQCVSPDIDDEP